MQATIINPISCFGIGVHSGKITQLTLKPAKVNTGIVFIRTDVKSVSNHIEAKYCNVCETSFSTTLKNSSNVQIATVEHLIAAIWGCGIDNLIVECDGPEIPIMDGSSKSFVFMLECAGKKIQNAPKKHLKILKPIKVVHQDCEIICEPSDTMEIDLTINFDSKIIGTQNILFNEQIKFKNDVANARTFGFVKDLSYLQSKGLAQGASLENAIGIDNDLILNQEGLRYKDEFVRHKLLDLIGDFFTSQGNIIGSFRIYKAGHTINNEFLRKLLSNPACYQWL